MHRCLRSVVAALGMVAGLVTAAQAQATFHVAVSGSDAIGDGSAGNPWATIEHAVGEVPDGALVLVGPGTYHGRVRLDRQFAQGILVRAASRYQARLRHTGTVVTSFTGQGIALEGFDIAHAGPGAAALVIQIQDLIGDPGGAERTGRIALRDNVIHDSYNNDLLKINNGAAEVVVAGNVFYNQSGSDEHIDVNSATDVVIEDNLFFNDFAGSGRANGNDTSSFIVVKDSNGGDDSNLGSERVTVRRNVFLNWEGSSGSNFVLCGEDGQPFYEARHLLVENNLLLGNSGNVMRAAFGVKGCELVTFRHNSVVGDLPALAFALRSNREGSNPVNDALEFSGNLWSDPTGTMGSTGAPGSPNDFSDSPPADTASFTLRRNLYWNGPGGEAALPFDAAELINYDDDPTRVVADPLLPATAGIALPRWLPGSASFGDGSRSVRDAFRRLVALYGTAAPGGPTTTSPNLSGFPADDILGRPRGGQADLGCSEGSSPILASDGFEGGHLYRWSAAAP